MKKSHIAWALLFVLSLSLTACSSDKEKKTLRIGAMSDVDSVPFIVADKNGYFEKEGIDVEIKRYDSARERDAALKSGAIDGAVSDIPAAIMAKDGGADIKITSKTGGRYKLVANKDMGIGGVAGLKGKDIALSKNTMGEYVADGILEKAGLKASDVNKVYVSDISAGLKALSSGKAEAAILPEPMAAEAVKGGAVFLAGSDTLGIDPGVVIFTENLVKSDHDAIKSVYKAYDKAVEYLNNQPVVAYMDIIIKDSGAPEDIRDAMQPPSYTKAEAPSKKDVDVMMDWLADSKLVEKSFSYKDLVDDEFVK